MTTDITSRSGATRRGRPTPHTRQRSMKIQAAVTAAPMTGAYLPRTSKAFMAIR